jgi:putative ABC transport system permease protein
MRHLLRLISLRYLRGAPDRSFLTLFGIMLGVAAIFAIDIVNGSVKHAFRNTIDSVAGKTALLVRSLGGVEEPGLEECPASRRPCRSSSSSRASASPARK